MENFTYTTDHNFVAVAETFKSESALVPVSFIDEVIERDISVVKLEDLMRFRTATRDAAKYEWVRFEDLEDVNLTGKIVWVWEDADYTEDVLEHCDYKEDKRWMTSSHVTGVQWDEEQWYYQFVFDLEFSDEESDDTSEPMLGKEFGRTESALIITPRV